MLIVFFFQGISSSSLDQLTEDVTRYFPLLFDSKDYYLIKDFYIFPFAIILNSV